LSLFVMDSTTFPFGGSRQPPNCRTALGDYEVCIVPTSSAVLALVGNKEEMAGALGELESLASQYPPGPGARGSMYFTRFALPTRIP
jgi:hypothetical protein